MYKSLKWRYNKNRGGGNRRLPLKIKKTLAKPGKIVYNSFAIIKASSWSVQPDIRRYGSCAMGHREPCQAGNRAALSGPPHVTQ